MKHTRIIVTRYGGPDALQVVEEDRPEPKDGEVRVIDFKSSRPSSTLSWNGHLRVVHRGRLASPGPETGGVAGKIVLVRNGPSLESGAA